MELSSLGDRTDHEIGLFDAPFPLCVNSVIYSELGDVKMEYSVANLGLLFLCKLKRFPKH